MNKLISAQARRLGRVLSQCLGVLFLLAVTAQAFAQPPSKIPVSLHVGGETRLASQLKIYLTGALMALGDVQITEECPEYGLEVVGAVSDKSNVIALSIVTSRREADKTLSSRLGDLFSHGTLPAWNPKFLKTPFYADLARSLAQPTTSPLVTIDHRIRLFEKNLLYDECTQIARLFDQQVLLPCREQRASATPADKASTAPAEAAAPEHGKFPIDID